MTIEERLETLERELARAKRGNRRLVLAGAGLLLGLFALLVVAYVAHDQAGPDDKKVIRANDFVLEDNQGRPRAILAVHKDGPTLGLFDEKGHDRAMLGSSQTKTPDGKVITYPESTLQLFGPDNNLIWQTP